jgi:hypothetical protein
MGVVLWLSTNPFEHLQVYIILNLDFWKNGMAFRLRSVLINRVPQIWSRNLLLYIFDSSYSFSKAIHTQYRKKKIFQINPGIDSKVFSFCLLIFKRIWPAYFYFFTARYGLYRHSFSRGAKSYVELSRFTFFLFSLILAKKRLDFWISNYLDEKPMPFPAFKKINKTAIS